MSKSHSWSRAWPLLLVLPILGHCIGTTAGAVSKTDPPDLEIIDMRPETPAPWSMRHLSAPIVSLLRGPSYMYGVREFSIETTPAAGYVDLFYVRACFQKRF